MTSTSEKDWFAVFEVFFRILHLMIRELPPAQADDNKVCSSKSFEAWNIIIYIRVNGSVFRVNSKED